MGAVLRVAALVAVASAALALAPSAFAGPCGLPDGQPVWVDFGVPELAPVFARPGVVLAVSSGAFPAQARAAGAQTVYWDMHLNRRVGTPTAPADPALMDARANSLFVFAASQTNCATPWIALNELFGASLETPWTANNAQYRANVLALVRGLAARGARPFLLISSEPYLGSEDAIAWWRELARYSDILPEVYPSARVFHAQGAVLANRRLRAVYRRAVARLVAVGIPLSRIGLILGFQSAPGTGGRDGLRPSQSWYEAVKWMALSARRVAGEMKIPTLWSWGWGTYSVEGRDPDKPVAGCVWLWARDRTLCNAPKRAGKVFNASRIEGQLIVPSGAMCRIGRNTISMTAIAKLNLLVRDRDVAYTALLARLAESTTTGVKRADVLAAETAVVVLRFGGSRSAYRAALQRAGATLDVARSVLADELRRRKIGESMRVPGPSSAAISNFYFSYPDVLVRAVRSDDAPWWLGGRKTGLVLEMFAPEQLFAAPLGRTSEMRTLTGRYTVTPLADARSLASVPLPQARPAIATALKHFARSDAVVRWSAARQRALLDQAICRRDDLPVAASIDLLAYLPFLALDGEPVRVR
jgi:hypothetical protein